MENHFFYQYIQQAHYDHAVSLFEKFPVHDDKEKLLADLCKFIKHFQIPFPPDIMISFESVVEYLFNHEMIDLHSRVLLERVKKYLPYQIDINKYVALRCFQRKELEFGISFVTDTKTALLYLETLENIPGKLSLAEKFLPKCDPYDLQRFLSIHKKLLIQSKIIPDFSKTEPLSPLFEFPTERIFKYAFSLIPENQISSFIFQSVESNFESNPNGISNVISIFIEKNVLSQKDIQGLFDIIYQIIEESQNKETLALEVSKSNLQQIDQTKLSNYYTQSFIQRVWHISIFDQNEVLNSNKDDQLLELLLAWKQFWNSFSRTSTDICSCIFSKISRYSTQSKICMESNSFGIK